MLMSEQQQLVLSLWTCPQLPGFVSVARVGELSPADSWRDRRSFTLAHAAFQVHQIRSAPACGAATQRPRLRLRCQHQIAVMARCFSLRSTFSPQRRRSVIFATARGRYTSFCRLSYVLVPPLCCSLARSQIHYGLQEYPGLPSGYLDRQKDCDSSRCFTRALLGFSPGETRQSQFFLSRDIIRRTHTV